MKIIRWSKERIEDYMWSAPAWVKEALEEGIAFAYLLIDDEQAKVAAWAACYIEEDHLEIISLGQEQDMAEGYSLERILRKLQSFCLERDINMSEIEFLDELAPKCKAALIRSDYVKTMDSKLWKLSGLSVKTALKDDFDIKTISALSTQEKASFIQLLKSSGKNIPQFAGSISSETMLVALRDGRAEACIFASRYRGALFVEQLVCKNDEAGQEAFKALCQRAERKNAAEELYVIDSIYEARIFGRGQETLRQVYVWQASERDELTDLEIDAELSVREDMTDVKAPLLLSKVYAAADMFTDEEVENYLALDQDMQPKLMAIIKGPAGEYMMDICPLADDIDIGYFRYEITTSFLCEKSGDEALRLCSSLNKVIKEGTAYINELDELVLRTHISESAFLESNTFNWLLHNWYESCQHIYAAI